MVAINLLNGIICVVSITNRRHMKLPNDIKQLITKELIDELHEDLIHFCLSCNADITAKELFCSSECLQQDLLRNYELQKKTPFTLEYHCHNCSGIMDEPNFVCSAVCLEEDLRKRK